MNTVLIVVMAIWMVTTEAALGGEHDLGNNSAPRVTTHTLIAAHHDVAVKRLAVVTVQREIAELRQSQIGELYRLGLASWLEQSQAQLESQVAEQNQESQQKLVQWLADQADISRSACLPINSVSMLVKLPESDIPIAWRQIETSHEGHHEGLHGIVLPSGCITERHRARLRVNRLDEKLSRLRVSSITNPTALPFAELQRHAALAEMDLIQSRIALDDLNEQAIRLVLDGPKRQDKTAENIPVKTRGSLQELNSRLVELVSEEASIPVKAELLAVHAWSRSSVASTQALQKSGLASVQELSSRRHNETQIASAISLQEELSEWKRNWISKHQSSSTDPGTRTPSGEDSWPDLSEITDIAVLDFLVTSVTQSVETKHQQSISKLRLELTSSLLSRLQGQSNASEAEVQNAERLKALHIAQLEQSTQRANLAMQIVEAIPELSTSIQRENFTHLLDDETLDALSRFESVQASHAGFSVSGIDRSMKSGRKRLTSLQKLRADGLASADEVASLEDQLLQLESEKVRFSQKQRHHSQRQKHLINFRSQHGLQP